jgi:hypothetical protein
MTATFADKGNRTRARYHPAVRRLFRILTRVVIALSFALFLAVVVLWVQSQFSRDFVAREQVWPIPAGFRGEVVAIGSGYGRVWWRRTTWQTSGGPEWLWPPEKGSLSRSPGIPFWITGSGHRISTNWFAGAGPDFEWAVDTNGYDGRSFYWRTLTVPYWALTAGLGLMPGAWLARAVRNWRRRRRVARAGRCAGCGYDLRATPDRCPECGRMPSATWSLT